MARCLLLLVFSVTICGNLAFSMPGGWSDVPVGGNGVDGEYDEILQTAINVATAELPTNSLTASNDVLPNTQPTIVRIQSQVVSGMKYRITFSICDDDNSCQECDMVVWVQVWTGKKEVMENGCNGTYKKKERFAREAGCAGCANEVDAASDEVQAALTFAMDEYNGMSNSMYRAQAVNIEKATSQVVAGIRYEVTVDIGMSECRNDPSNKGKTLADCPADSPVRQCRFSIWWRSWMEPQYQMVGTDCTQNASPTDKKKPEAPQAPSLTTA